LGVAVVHGGERGEALLPGCVPDLELDSAGGEGAFLGQEGGCEGALVFVDSDREVARVGREGSWGERTAYCGFFVFLKVVVDEAED